MTTATLSPDCTRKVQEDGSRSHRKGQWVCRRCLSVLRDSLEIAVHIGRSRSLNVAASRCSYGAIDRIAFECKEHGWEEA